MVGIIGRTEAEAAKTTMHEYRLLADGYEKKQRIYWEIARWEKWYDTMLSPDIKPIHKPKTPQKLCQFPWESEQQDTIKITPPSEAEIECLSRIFQQLKQRNG